MQTLIRGVISATQIRTLLHERDVWRHRSSSNQVSTNEIRTKHSEFPYSCLTPSLLCPLSDRKQETDWNEIDLGFQTNALDETGPDRWGSFRFTGIFYSRRGEMRKRGGVNSNYKARGEEIPSRFFYMNTLDMCVMQPHMSALNWLNPRAKSLLEYCIKGKDGKISLFPLTLPGGYTHGLSRSAAYMIHGFLWGSIFGIGNPVSEWNKFYCPLLQF